MHKGTLSAIELERFRLAITHVAHGVPAEPIEFSVGYGRSHTIRIETGRGNEITLTTTMRFIELGGLRPPSIWVTPEPEGAWIEPYGGTRFAALKKLPPEQVALRAVWIELESEILRAAGHAANPGEAGPILRLEPLGAMD